MHDTPRCVFTRHPVDWILTSDPAALGLALSAVTVSTVVCLLLALFWLLRLPRRAIAPRCARCRYLLADPVPAQCSECGADLADTKGIQRHVRGVRWRPALLALACAGLGLGAQWWLGAGWMPLGASASAAVESWQRSRADPSLDLVAPEVFVARAIEEASLQPAAVCVHPRYLLPSNFASSTRIAALRDAVLDPATRVRAFAAARSIQNQSTGSGDLWWPAMPEAEHVAIRRMLVDAVLLDPTLLGATVGTDGALELPPFSPSAPAEAYRYQSFASLDQEVDLNGQFYLDVPYDHAIIGSQPAIARIEGTIMHADGRRASRTIRFEPPSSMFGVLRPSRIWFVPAPTPDPAKWTVHVEGEIRHRFVSETLRDEAGKPLERVMNQRFRADIDRVEIRPSAP